MAESCSPPKGISVPDVKYWRVTQSKLHKVDLIIRVNKILSLEEGVAYESAEFYGGSENMKFRFIIKRSDSHWFHAYLKAQPGSGPSEAFFSCTFKLTVVDSSNGKTNKIIGEKMCYSLKDLESIYADFVCNSNSQFLNYESYGILCEVEFATDVEKHFTAHILAQSSSMCDHFGKLLDSQMFSDIKLVVDEKEFPAHKNILAARSDVFAAMFQHEMKETKSGQVMLTDVKPEVVEEMLRFIYTGESPNMKNLADELLVIAQKYALKDLQTKAEIELVDKLSVNTATDTLIFADLHNAEFLKNETIKFINLNSNKVVETDGWKTNLISHPVLIQQIYEAKCIIWNVLPKTDSLLFIRK